MIIKTFATQISRILRKEVAESEVISILKHLDFGVKAEGGDLRVQVPSYRATKDISGTVDLVEEIGRIIRYGSIASTALNAVVAPCGLSKARRLMRQTQDFFVLHAHANEIMTYPMVGEDLLRDAGMSNTVRTLTLENAGSPETAIMRDSIIPTTLLSVAQNQKHSNAFRTFEVGRIYLPDAKDFRTERLQVAYGDFNRNASTFVQITEQIESYLNYLGVNGEIIITEARTR